MRYRSNDYSVPVAYGHREVLIRGYVDEVVISCGAEVIARHRRSYDSEDLIFDPLHYARYSSDNQRDASIEDQLWLCRERAVREGWQVVDSYSDRPISGASLIRPGIQALMQDAQAGQFNIVLAESLDRISRDQEDIAGVYKRLSFACVRMVTLSEGDISELHIGLKGTMGALYLKDLADKTRRGLRGRVEDGKPGGGNHARPAT